jgi:hypothetical protein
MTEPGPCRLCRHANPPGNRFCGSCGTPLRSGEQLATRQEHRPVPTRPAKLGSAGKVLAVGVAVLAAEASLSWMRRKMETGDRASVSVVRGAESASSGFRLSQCLEEVLVQAWLEDGTLRVRTGGPRPRTVLRVTFWFVLILGLVVALEVRYPGSWIGIVAGAIALILALLLLLAAADAVIRHEYRFSPHGGRGTSRLLGVPCRTWTVPAPAIGSLYIQQSDDAIVLAGTGFRHRIRLGVLPRRGELRWVAAHVEAALKGTALPARSEASGRQAGGG